MKEILKNKINSTKPPKIIRWYRTFLNNFYSSFDIKNNNTVRIQKTNECLETLRIIANHSIMCYASIYTGLPFFFSDFIYLFLERGEGKEKERERNIHVWLPLVRPLVGSWPATQACALTGNQPATLWFAGWHSTH